MKRNIGKIDRALRLLMSAFLLWLGLFELNGLSGDLVGIGFASVATMPLYMVITGSCVVYRMLGIHSFSREECSKLNERNKHESDSI